MAKREEGEPSVLAVALALARMMAREDHERERLEGPEAARAHEEREAEEGRALEERLRNGLGLPRKKKKPAL